MSTYNSRRLDRIEESLNRLDAPGVPNPITGDLFSKEDVERAMAELAEEPNRPRVLGIPHVRFAAMLESEIAPWKPS